MSDVFKIQKTQTGVEIDRNNSSAYIFIPPYRSNGEIRISSSKTIKTSSGQIILDFEGDFLAGIEIPASLVKIAS